MEAVGHTVHVVAKVTAVRAELQALRSELERLRRRVEGEEAPNGASGKGGGRSVGRQVSPVNLPAPGERPANTPPPTQLMMTPAVT